MTDLTSSFAGHFTFGYDALSRRTSLNRPNAVNTTYAYDSVSRLLSVLHQLGSTTIDGASYGVDAAGNRVSKTNYIDGSSENYAYDALYQLTQVIHNGSTSENYTYDGVGNRLSSVGVPSYTVNSSNELTSTSAATFTYDSNGNTLTKTDSTGTTSYAWDFENRLVSVTLPGTGGSVTFKYDPFGRRIQKGSSSGTINFAYDGANAVEELNTAGTVTAQYAQGSGIDEPLATNRGGTPAFYEADGLGSVTSLTNGAGSALAAYTTDAFGKPVSTADSTVNNPFRYTARDYDSETGLYYYRARYYDPSIGRFISEDPIGFLGGVNAYTYVSNDPVNKLDPFGEATCVFYVARGILVCYPWSSANGGILRIPVASGNNGDNSGCKNNSKCQDQANRGPIPQGWWKWTNDSTSKPNGRVLEPLTPNDPRFPAGGTLTNTFGRGLFRSHSCRNAFGPSLNPPFCSAGCVTGSADDIKQLNKLLDAEPGSVLSVVPR